jgi:hypothetical protein
VEVEDAERRDCSPAGVWGEADGAERERFEGERAEGEPPQPRALPRPQRHDEQQQPDAQEHAARAR